MNGKITSKETLHVSNWNQFVHGRGRRQQQTTKHALLYLCIGISLPSHICVRTSYQEMGVALPGLDGLGSLVTVHTLLINQQLSSRLRAPRCLDKIPPREMKGNYAIICYISTGSGKHATRVSLGAHPRKAHYSALVQT